MERGAIWSNVVKKAKPWQGERQPRGKKGNPFKLCWKGTPRTKAEG